MTSNVLIRKATKKDLTAIIRLSLGMLPHHIQFSEYYTPIKNKAKWKKLSTKYFRKLMKSKNAKFFIAEEKRNIVGYAIGEIKKNPPVLAEKYYGEVGEIYINREYRGKGIASKLIKEIFLWLKRRKMPRAFILFDARNERAKKVYEKLGFKSFQEKYEFYLK